MFPFTMLRGIFMKRGRRRRRLTSSEQCCFYIFCIFGFLWTVASLVFLLELISHPDGSTVSGSRFTPAPAATETSLTGSKTHSVNTTTVRASTNAKNGEKEYGVCHHRQIELSCRHTPIICFMYSRLGRVKHTWEVSQRTCEREQDGGTLVMFSDVVTLGVMLEDYTLTGNSWIGLKRNSTAAPWFWIDGSPLKIDNNSLLRFKLGKHGNCGYVTQGFVVKSGKCSSKREFICMIPKLEMQDHPYCNKYKKAWRVWS